MDFRGLAGTLCLGGAYGNEEMLQVQEKQGDHRIRVEDEAKEF